jgi:hypothetical protein
MQRKENTGITQNKQGGIKKEDSKRESKKT